MENNLCWEKRKTLFERQVLYSENEIGYFAILIKKDGTYEIEITFKEEDKDQICGIIYDNLSGAIDYCQDIYNRAINKVLDQCGFQEKNNGALKIRPKGILLKEKAR